MKKRAICSKAKLYINNKHCDLFKNWIMKGISHMLYSDLSRKNVKGVIPLELNNMEALTEL